MVKKIALGFGLLVLYLASTVPVGLFLYSLKSNADINIFSKTGFHTYMYCLRDQVGKIHP